MTDAPAPTTAAATRTRVFIGSLSGSAIEWFDFFLYATAASIIFDTQFFPSDDPLVSQMLAYVSLALTFFIRPLGGVVFAHIGDRIGRKKTLVLTISLMCASTVAIGLLPNFATVGLLAPILLICCRILQGIAIGGEWGGALLLAYEYAPQGRRGLYGAIPQTGITIGMLLSTIAFSIVSALPEEQFEAWGWRLPFIASIVLVVIGLWIRNGLAETPKFVEAQGTGDVVKVPLLTTLRDHWRSVLIAIGAKAVETAPFYVFATFSVSYATGVLDFERSTALNAVSLAAAVSTIMIVVCGAISDRVGRRTVFLTGAVLLGAFAAPFFLMLDIRVDWALFAALTIGLGLFWSPTTATLGTLTSEIFSTRVRYTGVTLGYQVGAALAGGTAPLIATWMLAVWDDAWWPIATYLVLIAAISILAVALSPAATRKERALLRARGEADTIDIDTVAAPAR